ncbi:uncharacterized protein RAG0_03836 [Rhynchosporium agropyri]|uniref:MOZ protein represents a chromatin-associated acetyltransferase n=1 Tax=Rhynchosporium agropyri TaxID=914238 RepID=A0A1E1KAG1_9HELO|nr:uncharacterized protein RAG0_03836 [Rhynchosporium agropyri]
MSTTRLTFLYPALLRNWCPRIRTKSSQLSRKAYANLCCSEQRGSQARFRCLHSRNLVRSRPRSAFCTDPNSSSGTNSNSCYQSRKPISGTRRSFSTTSRKRERLLQRHGKAVEPFLHGEETVDAVKLFTPEDKGERDRRLEGEKKAAGKEGEDAKEKEDTNEVLKSKTKEQGTVVKGEPSSTAPLSEETQRAAYIPGDEGSGSENPTKVKEPAADGKVETSQNPLSANTTSTSTSTSAAPTPIETVLHMPPPETAEEENASKPPHLQTPPYVHHFDTYTLVQQVEAGGFTGEQAITSMKAVRGLLALNLEVARKGLVSKSDVENETYLFRAACSELRTEIQNTRKKNEEGMRRERTLLQHEVDILNQKLSQELLTLKDDLKGMFDDRKMSVRMEQRTMESKIQELNYKITVLLNSDSKSEIEGLRWVLTRRSVMGILFMAFMVLTSLRFASYKSHEDEMRAKKAEELAKSELSFGGNGHGNGGGFGGGGGSGLSKGDLGTAEILAAS